MNSLFSINDYPVVHVISNLLQDKTTKQNIIWATDTYETLGDDYSAKSQIMPDLILGAKSEIIIPRVQKATDTQADRTKAKAEVFTPSWVCNKMNNHCDEEWFEYKPVFNTEKGESWVTSKNKIVFKGDKTWGKYIKSPRIEITCGEAPYIVSRYDAASGEYIPIKDRIGLLDRKLRVICENIDHETEWIEWALEAFRSVYGYEFQGDNLLIARINLLCTFAEYLEASFNRKATISELRKVANIICWNFWQMDGITNTIPYGIAEQEEQQLCLFDFMINTDEKITTPICRIYDWSSNKSIPYTFIKRG